MKRKFNREVARQTLRDAGISVPRQCRVCGEDVGQTDFKRIHTDCLLKESADKLKTEIREEMDRQYDDLHYRISARKYGVPQPPPKRADANSTRTNISLNKK